MAGREQGVEVGPGARQGRLFFLFAGVHEAGFELLAGLVFAVVLFLPLGPGERGGAGDGQRLTQGLAPGLADAIQVLLGGVAGLDGYRHICGFSGHGFMLAPMAASRMAQTITTGEPDEIVASLSLDRFANGDVEADAFVVG